jgi:hypothetical protein
MEGFTDWDQPGNYEPGQDGGGDLFTDWNAAGNQESDPYGYQQQKPKRGYSGYRPIQPE